MNRKMIAKELVKIAKNLVASEDLEKEAEVSTDPDRLRKLSEEIDWTVRVEVAYNENTPVDVLRELAEDEMWYVRAGVAQNPKTPKDVLKKLANDSVNEIRTQAVSHLMGKRTAEYYKNLLVDGIVAEAGRVEQLTWRDAELSVYQETPEIFDSLKKISKELEDLAARAKNMKRK